MKSKSTISIVLDQTSRKIALAKMSKAALAAFFLALLGMAANNAAAQTVLVSEDSGNGVTPSNIGSYTTSGGTNNASFISGVVAPYQMAADSSQVYVAELGAGQVSIFNYSGSSVNTISLAGAIGVAVSGTNLYTASGGTVGRYNAQTGALIDANFITGLSGLRNLLVDGSGNLFVAQYSGNQVSKYDSTGTAVGAFTTIALNGAFGLALDGNNLFVSDFGSTNSVLQYNATTGGLINASFVTGVAGTGMEVYNNTLYVADYSAQSVKTYNATSGAAIGNPFLSFPNYVTDVVIVPEPATLTMALLGAGGLLFFRKRRAARV